MKAKINLIVSDEIWAEFRSALIRENLQGQTKLSLNDKIVSLIKDYIQGQELKDFINHCEYGGIDETESS